MRRTRTNRSDARSWRRTASAVLVAGAAALAVPAATAVAADSAAGSDSAAECQYRQQALGFSLTGTLEIEVCPPGSRDWEVRVKTLNTGAGTLYGYTRVTGSDGTSYTGAWHGHMSGSAGFYEGLDVPDDAPAGTQYCGQFFQQSSSSEPVSETSTPVCLTLP